MAISVRILGLRFHWLDVAATVVLVLALVWTAFNPWQSSYDRIILRWAFILSFLSFFYLHFIKWGSAFEIRLATIHEFWQEGHRARAALAPLAVLAVFSLSLVFVAGFWCLYIGGAIGAFDWASARQNDTTPYITGRNEILSNSGLILAVFPNLQELGDGVYRGIVDELALWAGQIAGLGIFVELSLQTCWTLANIADRVANERIWTRLIQIKTDVVA